MNKNKHRVWRFIYKLHRYIGLVSAFILFMLATTGIALNHTEYLNLDSRMLESNAILNWYGIKPNAELKSFATKNHWLTLINQQVYFDQSLLVKNKNNLIGAVETSDFIVIAFNNSLLLLSLQGEIIEQISLPKVKQIGLDYQQSIVIASEKETISSDDGLISWHPHYNRQVRWSKATQTPTFLANPIQSKFRTSSLPMERVLLDLHSGRIFGSVGVIIVDITGIFLIVLALSGCAIWLKHKLRSFRNSLKSKRKKSLNLKK